MTGLNTAALIVEGGAMRSVYSAGVLDGFLRHRFNPFQMYMGVSAGASNTVAYLSSAEGAALEVYHDSALRSEFISYSRFLRGGDLVDLDWLLEASLRKVLPSFDGLRKKDVPFYVAVTDVMTGRAAYINACSLGDERELMVLLKASMALPLFYRQFPEIDGRQYTDGGVADGIPIAEAIRCGARKIMIIRARHRDYIKQDTLVHRFVRMNMIKYPALVQTMQRRIRIHAESIALIRNPPEGVTVLEVCPPESLTLGRFCRDKARIKHTYQEGLRISEKTINEWSSLCAAS